MTAFASQVTTAAALAVFGLVMLVIVRPGLLQASVDTGRKAKRKKRKTKGKRGAQEEESISKPIAPPTAAPPADPALPPNSPAQPKSLAQRRLEKVHRKEAPAVRDMIDHDVVSKPVASLVARIPANKANKAMKPPASTAASGYSSYEHVGSEDFSTDEHSEELDEPWEEVSAKPKVLSLKTTQSPSPSATPSRIVPGLPASLVNQSKKARQNAARNAALRDAKAQAEVERQARLSEHRKGRADDTNRAARRKAQDANARSENMEVRKTLSGGMRAAVTDTGALIWE